MEVLKIFGLWDQEIDSWFTNQEPLIPTLIYYKTVLVWELILIWITNAAHCL